METTLYEQIRDFVGWSDEDAQNLQTLAPLVAEHGAAITDAFYAKLGDNENTAPMIAGRVDALKATHAVWMRGLVAGDYGDAYFDRQVKVGKIHVVQGVEPRYVELIFSQLREMMTAAIKGWEPDRARALALERSILKLLDIDSLLINHAYNEERLDRLANFTGFNRRLIENCITRPD